MPAKETSALTRWLPLFVLLSALGLFFYFDGARYLSFAQLQLHRETLLSWAEQHPWLAVLSYLCVYILGVAVSIPGATFLTLVGGFVFGPLLGTAYTVAGATVGASLLFLAARSALGGVLTRKAGPWVRKMEKGFQENALNYLFVLRLVPLFPFWLVNIVPAILNVPLRTYVLATFFGIMPGSFVYVSVGNGLGAVLDAGQEPNLQLLTQPQVLLPILGLAILALIPVIYKRFRKSL